LVRWARRRPSLSTPTHRTGSRPDIGGLPQLPVAIREPHAASSGEWAGRARAERYGRSDGVRAARDGSSRRRSARDGRRNGSGARGCGRALTARGLGSPVGLGFAVRCHRSRAHDGRRLTSGGLRQAAMSAEAATRAPCSRPDAADSRRRLMGIRRCEGLAFRALGSPGQALLGRGWRRDTRSGTRRPAPTCAESARFTAGLPIAVVAYRRLKDRDLNDDPGPGVAGAVKRVDPAINGSLDRLNKAISGRLLKEHAVLPARASAHRFPPAPSPPGAGRPRTR
jgi:hypothetical protein